MGRRAVALLNFIRTKSVFNPMGNHASMESMLATSFHRASATVYFVYTLWAAAAIVNGIPSIIEANGIDVQTAYSIATLLLAAPACFGATFWPLFARLEAYAGSGFVGLILFYLATLLWDWITGDGSITGVIIIASILVIPASRLVIIVVFLIRQAKANDQRPEND